MESNLTKRTSPDEPVQERLARTNEDDRIHLVDAAPVDLVDPAPLRTRCGIKVLEVYNTTPEDVSCQECTATMTPSQS
jgi:hypothetical protein